MNKVINKITPETILQINNILRSLGLKTSNTGTKIINKTIQYVIKYDIEFITLDDIFKVIANEYGLNVNTIRNNVSNALANRNIHLSKTNFEKIFGYEYYDKNFEPKIFIEELCSLIKNSNNIFKYFNIYNK